MLRSHPSAVAVLLVVAGTADASDPAFDDFPSGMPTLPAPLDRLEVGMTEREVLKTLGTSVDRECYTLGVRVGRLCVAPFWMSGNRHAVLFKSLPAARGAFRKKWGEPAVLGDHWYWVNPAEKPPLRATLRSTNDPAQLDLETYLPLRSFLGDGPKLAFEKVPIIGSSAEALEKAYGANCEGETCSIPFPPHEVGPGQLVMIAVKGGKATRFWFDLPLKGDNARTEYSLKLLEGKWGPRKTDPESKRDFTFPKRADVKAAIFAGDLTVTISPGTEPF